MVEFNKRFEEQINQHINQNAYTDRKLSGSIIGTTAFGGTGFLVFQGTLVFGISGSKSFLNSCFSHLGSYPWWLDWEPHQTQDRSLEA
jgi:hypothetical protein